MSAFGRFFQHTLGMRTARLFIVFNSLLLLLVGTVTAVYSSYILEQEVTNYAENTLHQAVVLLDSNLADARSRIIRLAATRAVNACLLLESPTITKTLAQERIIDQSLQGINLFRQDIEDVLILGNNGYVYNLAKREDLFSDYDFTAAPWYQAALNTQEGIYIRILGLHDQDFYRPRIKRYAAKAPTISISMAVVNKAREPIGAVFLNFNLRAMGALFMEGNFERSGKIALVGPDGVIASQNDNENVGEVLPLSPENKALLAEAQTGGFLQEMHGEQHLLHFMATSFRGWKLISYVPMREIHAHALPILWMLIPFLLFCLLSNGVIGWAISRAIQKPVVSLVHSVNRVDETRLTPIPTEYPYVELTDLAAKFNELLSKLDALIHREYIAQIALGRSQMHALQSQIRPHFLFNTLQMLQTEILYNHTEAADEIIVALSRFLRYTIDDGHAEVRVAEEIAYLREYLALFVHKYNGRLTVRVDIAPEAESCLLPKLLLQPLAENCLKHGFRDNPMEDALIEISARIEGETLQIEVRDNGEGMSPRRLAHVQASLAQEEAGGRIGLRNVHQRIRVIYEKPYGLSISATGQGTVVRLTLPILRRDEDA